MVILCEALTVALSGVPFSSAHYYTAYLVSTYLSVAIIGLMLSALILVLLRRDGLVLPYPLGTMLWVLLYLCNSSMLEGLEVLSSLDTKARNRIILETGRKLKYGRLTDLDGGLIYGIDYESFG